MEGAHGVQVLFSDMHELLNKWCDMYINKTRLAAQQKPCSHMYRMNRDALHLFMIEICYASRVSCLQAFSLFPKPFRLIYAGNVPPRLRSYHTNIPFNTS